MNLKTYETSEHVRYARLAQTIADILSVAIRARKGLHLQHVQHRAKGLSSLRRKLEDRRKTRSRSIEEVVKDLAGCRLVFYTNSDVETFQQSGILRENFDIDWERTKPHYPAADAAKANELFISVNYVVRLKEDRTALPEYADLAGLWCEVQVQTTLNHAWSEMAHDTIYKPPVLKGFGKAAMEGIETRMTKIMRDYLLPAGYEFQKVAADFERLSQGKELFDKGPLEALTSSRDNNERHELMQRFISYVLPNYDDPEAAYPEIRTALLEVVRQARTAPTKPIETPFGSLPGHTADQIAGLVASVLEHFRYVDVEGTFDTLAALFGTSSNENERKRWLAAVQVLAEPHLEVWKQVGPLVQQLLIDRVAALDESVRDKLRPVALKVLTCAVSPEIGGTTSTYNTVTLHRAATPASDVLRDMRAKAVGQLQQLFDAALNDADRVAVMQAFSEAERTPYNTNYTDELFALVLTATSAIVDFYTTRIESLSYQLRQKIEHSVFWTHYRTRELPADVGDKPLIVPLRKQLAASIASFRGKVGNDPDYEIYKTLVGFESVFPHTWDGAPDYAADEAFRNHRVEELVAQVDSDNAELWLGRLERCADTDSRDLATFPTFGRFLEILSHQKPDIVLTYIPRLSDRLASFLPAMLRGLAAGTGAAAANDLMRGWLASEERLGTILRYLRFAKPLDVPLLYDAFTVTLKLDHRDGILDAIATACREDIAEQVDLRENVLLRGIRTFSDKGDHSWINAVWFLAPRGSLFVDLTPEQADLVLGSMVGLPSVDYHAEAILLPIARSFPDKVLDLFGARLAKDRGEDRFEPVPYGFNELAPALASAPEVLIDRAAEWFKADEVLFQFRGGRLVTSIFPQVTGAFEAALIARVQRGNDDERRFVLQITRAYHGEAFLLNVCKEAVTRLKPGHPLLQEVEIVLSTTGIVTGEFGFVDAYERRKVELAPWLDDSRTRVRSFAGHMIRSLDRQIAAERQRAQEQLEARKRQYPDSSDEKQ